MFSSHFIFESLLVPQMKNSRELKRFSLHNIMWPCINQMRGVMARQLRHLWAGKSIAQVSDPNAM